MGARRIEQGHPALPRRASRILSGALVALLARSPLAAAQQPVDAAAPDVVAAQPARVDAGTSPEDAAEQARPSSTETGQSPLDESFAPRSHAEWVRDTRRKAWQDTTFDVQVRTYYLDRDRFDDSESEAWALGGSVGFETGYFRERFAFGATGYTSQRLYGPTDKDGTALLKPGQRSYTVLGEAYGEFLINPGTRLTVGRRGIDTPYLNRNDSRMTPQTFEAITLQGLYGGGDDDRAEWRAGAGYFDEIKQRNSDEFVSMATAAGAPDGVDRGVYAAGANYRKNGFSLGAIDYYSPDILNIFYAETTYALRLDDRWRLQFALQHSDQQGVGDNLLRGEGFSSRQWGGKAELGVGGALLTAAYTATRGDITMQSPWGGYPGYTSVQIEDFNRAGEEAWMLRAAYNVPYLEGLSVYGLWVNGSKPDAAGEYAKDEYDFNLQWKAGSGALKGLMLRLRYAHVSQHDPANSDLDDVRVMIYYDPPAL